MIKRLLKALKEGIIIKRLNFWLEIPIINKRKHRRWEMYMKINRPNYVQFINQMYNKNNDKYEKKEKKDTQSDRIELSKTSHDLKKYIEQIKKAETGNEEKIQKIKELLDQGTYKVSSKELAGIIVDKMKEQSKGNQED